MLRLALELPHRTHLKLRRPPKNDDLSISLRINRYRPLYSYSLAIRLDLDGYRLTTTSTPLVDPISVKAFFPKSALIRFNQNVQLVKVLLVATSTNKFNRERVVIVHSVSAKLWIDLSDSIVQSSFANRYSNVARPTKLSIPQTECAHSRPAKSYVTRCLAKIGGQVNLTTSDWIDSLQKLTTWCSYLARTFSCLHH
ncbi:hypothetical protein PGT21_021174 [Puccinia graminis f. sp. tritici]|nr:hypothetical protein PGT21_021174 [Puccinia graminis f. sp. tritici]